VRSAYQTGYYCHEPYKSSGTIWYRVWVGGHADTYFEDEITLVQELEIIAPTNGRTENFFIEKQGDE